MNNVTHSQRKAIHANQLEFTPIDCLNWSSFPYKPEVQFKITSDDQCIFLHFKVREKSLRAVATAINGDVYKDSCVEFFISPLSDGNYYNFEFNCIGTPHVAFGPDRHNRQRLPEDVIKQIKIKPSLPSEPFPVMAGDFSWEMEVAIPVSCFIHEKIKSLKGLTARANFYKCGDETAEPHFLSWNPVKTENPDFHQYAYFGELNF